MPTTTAANGFERTSILTCPKCGHSAAEEMPLDACIYFHTCPGCGETFRPLPGDCCVFCSYGTVPCPPIQQRRGCRG
ncbi:MAG: GDCCVxC domain-containing (seleno)protein [Proteobacteria bacterium]|nr:GDCCVxC domain-containing (seleno)protein [Pseudomonadota bacterium]